MAVERLLTAAGSEQSIGCQTQEPGSEPAGNYILPAKSTRDFNRISPLGPSSAAPVKLPPHSAQPCLPPCSCPPHPGQPGSVNPKAPGTQSPPRTLTDTVWPPAGSGSFLAGSQPSRSRLQSWRMEGEGPRSAHPIPAVWEVGAEGAKLPGQPAWATYRDPRMKTEGPG